MPTVEFLRPRLHGARFENGEIPLEVLGDLAALREMVLEVAEWRFLQDNPGRQRSPRGFADKVDLKLIGIESGTAIPVIGLSSPQSVLPGSPQPHQEYFEQAMRYIINAVASAKPDSPSSTGDQMPTKYLAYFDRVGRSLRQGESIELYFPSGKTSAHLDQEKRRYLLALSQIRELTKEVYLRGSVPEVDQDRMTFELQPIYGHKIHGPIPKQHHDTILEACNGYRDGVRVLVHGIGKYNQQNRLLALESIEHISLLDPLDVPARLDEFRDMKDGWAEGMQYAGDWGSGYGKAPSPAGLDWLARSFESFYPVDGQLPYTYPTPEGGVQVEWSLGSNEISLEIDLTNHTGEWHRLDLNTNISDAKSLDLEYPSAWVWLAEEVQRLESGPE
jgi:hypothetical protein